MILVNLLWDDIHLGLLRKVLLEKGGAEKLVKFYC